MKSELIRLNPLQFGSVTLPNNLLLAPMTGITNAPFRKIAKKHGAGFAYTQMISAHGLLNSNQKTLDLAYVDPRERPVGIQIFGNDLEIMAIAAQIVEPNCDVIDINFGCPVPKVTENDYGAALLKDPKQLGKIVYRVVKSVDCPVTVKFRSGWDDNSIRAKEVAVVAESSGASAVTLHPRTRDQGYRGFADWTLIAEVKQAVKIPVIGNGDVRTPIDAKRMFDQTDCDAIMFGRGALANPWIFSHTMTFLQTGVIPPEPTAKERIDLLLTFAKKLIRLRGEHSAMRAIGSRLSWYVQGIPFLKEIRKATVWIETYEELEEILGIYHDRDIYSDEIDHFSNRRSRRKRDRRNHF